MGDVERAWVSVYGTSYDLNRSACIHFTAGWIAAQRAVPVVPRVRVES